MQSGVFLGPGVLLPVENIAEFPGQNRVQMPDIQILCQIVNTIGHDDGRDDQQQKNVHASCVLITTGIDGVCALPFPGAPWSFTVL